MDNVHKEMEILRKIKMNSKDKKYYKRNEGL
jgi:hypothetical protein